MANSLSFRQLPTRIVPDHLLGLRKTEDPWRHILLPFLDGNVLEVQPPRPNLVQRNGMPRGFCTGHEQEIDVLWQLVVGILEEADGPRTIP